MLEDRQRPVSLTCETLTRVNFACTQNDVALVRRLCVHNGTDAPLEKVRVTMRAIPPVIRQRDWFLDRVAPGSDHEVADVGVELDIERLAGLNEAEVGELELRVEAEGTEPFLERRPLILLARDEWGGLSDMAQLLAAFVAPNEPAVARLLKNASRLLLANGEDGSLDGYQSGESSQSLHVGRCDLVGLQQRWVWATRSRQHPSSATDRRCADPHGSPMRDWQPASIRRSCWQRPLKQPGLNPVVLFSQGHAWVGVWIQRKDFGHVTEPDVVAVRKAVQAHEFDSGRDYPVDQAPSLRFPGRRRRGTSSPRGNIAKPSS